jgi:hypothetical protein
MSDYDDDLYFYLSDSERVRDLCCFCRKDGIGKILKIKYELKNEICKKLKLIRVAN